MRLPIARQIASVEREIALRERVYPRFVESKRITQKLADEEIAAMRAVLETLREIEDRERLL